MDTYKSEAQVINCDINTIYSKLVSPSVFRRHIDANLDRLPEEARANLDKVKFDDDAITIDSPMGSLRLAVNHDLSMQPGTIVYQAAQSPVAFNMIISLNPISDTQTESVAALEMELPAFLKAMVGKQLEQAASKFGSLLTQLPYGDL